MTRNSHWRIEIYWPVKNGSWRPKKSLGSAPQNRDGLVSGNTQFFFLGLIVVSSSTINTDFISQVSRRKIRSISGLIAIVNYTVTSRRLQESGYWLLYPIGVYTPIGTFLQPDKCRMKWKFISDQGWNFVENLGAKWAPKFWNSGAHFNFQGPTSFEYRFAKKR